MTLPSHCAQLLQAKSLSADLHDVVIGSAGRQRFASRESLFCGLAILPPFTANFPVWSQK
jgi:hypothetical protein